MKRITQFFFEATGTSFMEPCGHVPPKLCSSRPGVSAPGNLGRCGVRVISHSIPEEKTKRVCPFEMAGSCMNGNRSVSKDTDPKQKGLHMIYLIRTQSGFMAHNPSMNLNDAFFLSHHQLFQLLIIC